jgi:hypothetical protein
MNVSGVMPRSPELLQRVVTKPSLIPGKPTRIGGQYFLYWEVTYWLAVGGWPLAVVEFLKPFLFSLVAF